MKISYSDYIKKTDVSVLVAEAIFSQLIIEHPCKLISDVAETTSGGTPLRSNSDFYNGNIAWLKSGELNDGWIDKSEEFISENGLKNSSAKLHPKGTLLLAMYGATAGRTGITKIEASTNQAVCALFPNEQVIQEYLFWFLRQHRYKFIEISKGGAQPNLSQSVINETKLPVPNKNLQKQIADLLFKIENEKRLDISIVPKEFREKVNSIFYTKNLVLENAAELIAQKDLAKQLCQAFLKEAMQGKLTKQNAKEGNATDLLKEINAEKEKLIAEKKLKKQTAYPQIKEAEIPFSIPKNWAWCRLGMIGICQTGTTPSTTVKEYFGKDIPFIKPADITLKGLITDNEGLSFLGLKEGVLIPNNSLMMVCIGGSIGKSYYTDFNVSCNQQINTITPFAEITAQFLQYFLQSDYFQKAIWAKAAGGTTPIVNRSKWESILIPLPPLAEQERIVKKLEEVMNLCEELKTTITDNQNYTNQLLQVALKDALQMKEVEVAT